jgi:hypothetical protein
MAKTAKPKPKKPYVKPTLTVYGTVQEMTETRGNRGHKDKMGNRAPAHTAV